MTFKALEAGTLSVAWYDVSAGARLAKKVKPVLVASGQMTFSAAGPGKLKIRLTAAGKRLLEHSRQVKVEIKGVFRSQARNVVSVAGQLVVTVRS